LTALPRKHSKKLARKLALKYEQTDIPVKDKNGNVLTTDHAGDDLKRSTGHFEELLRQPPHQNPSDVTVAEEVRQINCDRPSKTGTEKTSYHMTRGKASGPYKIPSGIDKAEMENFTEMLNFLVAKMWDEERNISTERKEGYLVTLPKKGDLQSRLGGTENGGECQLRDDQAGFRGQVKH